MIDWARVDELTEEIGSADLAFVLQMFVGEVRTRIEHLRLDDMVCLSEDLHFIKSSALNIGMSGLADIAAKGEMAANAGRVDITTDALHEVLQKSEHALVQQGHVAA